MERAMRMAGGSSAEVALILMTRQKLPLSRYKLY